MLITINKWFEMMGQSAVPNQVVIQLIALAIIVLSAYIANFIVKGIVLKAIKTVFKATKSNWDDIFLEKQVFHRMVNLVPALIIWRFVPEVFPSKVMTGSSFASTCQTVMLIVMLFIAIRTINAFFAAFEEIYDQFERIILAHGVREVSELAYSDYIENVLPNDEYLGEMVREKLVYYPTVTREPYKNNGRLTTLIECGKLFLDLDQPYPTLHDDRFMMCGSPSMLKDLVGILESKGFIEARNINPGHFVIERAFVES